jgi:dipeptidyl aminopeptidase/acylaminoacyl peptidase
MTRARISIEHAGKNSSFVLLLVLPRFVLVIFSTLLLGVTSLRAVPSERLISAADLVKIKEVGSPQFSPDGTQVVYTVRSIESHRPGDYYYNTQLWLAFTDGHTPARQLTRGEDNASSPTWNPSGDQIAFVRTEYGKPPQLWIISTGKVGGGEAVPITHFSSGATDPHWSPDGKQLLFTATLTLSEAVRELEIVRPAVPVPWFGERPGRRFADTTSWLNQVRRTNPASVDNNAANVPAPTASVQDEREWLARNEAAEDPVVITRLDFLGEQDLEPTEAFTHLYVIDAHENAAPIPLTPGFASYTDAVWYPSSNGLQILFSGDAQVSRHPDRILERDLWLVSAQGGPMKRLLHDEQFAYTAPALSPDGSSIAFLANDLTQAGFGHTLLCVLPTQGGPRRFLTTRLDRSVQLFRWAADSQSILIVAASNGGFPLFRVALNGTRIDRLTTLAHGISSFDVRSSGIVAAVTRYSNPSELYLYSPRGDEPVPLTAHNSEWLRGKLLSVPDRREINMPDGIQVDSFEMKPTTVEPGRKYPLLVEIHGGPQSMWGPGVATTWHEFQYFTSRGYGIVFCNPRGSAGYGAAFQHESYQNWGPGPSRDVLAATDAAAQNGWSDPTREVITGGSYGGYLTVWTISQDHRFKAAAAERGVYELSLFFGEGNAWRLVPYQFGGYPWQPEIRSILNAQSPLTQVAHITTPLLINHGDSDLRAGVIQSEMLYKSLKVLNMPVEYVRYPGASHNVNRFGDPKQRIDRLIRLDEFFQRYIGPVAP